MANEPTILLVGDFITDRTWLMGEPSLLERYNSHYSVHPHTLVDPTRETDVAGGIATVARTMAAVIPNPITVVGAWSYYVANEFSPREQLVPKEGLLKHRSIDFQRVYESDFTSIKTRVYLPTVGGARLCYRFDRNSDVRVKLDPARYRHVDWPDPSEVGLVILGDYGYGVLHLPEVQTELQKYAGTRTPIILRSSDKTLVKSLPWDVLMLNLYHLANFLEQDTFDTPVTKQVNGECTYHPSLIDALTKMSKEALQHDTLKRALLLNLEGEGALVLHNDRIMPYIFAAPYSEAVTGVGANDVLLAHFAVKMHGSTGALGDRLHESAKHAVCASSAFVSKALQLETLDGWSAPRLEVTAHDLERATPVLQRTESSLEKLAVDVAHSRDPLVHGTIRLRDASWYLDGFHTVSEAFGAEIVRLKTRIKEYVGSGTPKRPFLAVLCGDPGAGKSTLAEALGRYSGCEVITANAAQWTSADDLFELCERIRNARMLGKTPLAFIDEVDSPSHNNDLYAKLLAPVWDGTYSVRGTTRTLGTPTVFLLAGSTKVWRRDEDLLDSAKKGDVPKLEDLVSRLSARPLQIPPLTERPGDVAYLVANQIMRKFPRVTEAVKHVFELFTGSKCRHGARSMSMVIDMFGPLHAERCIEGKDLRGPSMDELSLYLHEVPKSWKHHTQRIGLEP